VITSRTKVVGAVAFLLVLGWWIVDREPASSASDEPRTTAAERRDRRVNRASQPVWWESVRSARQRSRARVTSEGDQRGRQSLRTTPVVATDLFGPRASDHRLVVPPKHEADHELDWDEVSPRVRVDRALVRFEAALEKAADAPTDRERDEWRDTAMAELSAVRADMVQLDGNLDRYATLQERIDD
jgi:hypothetical protein